MNRNYASDVMRFRTNILVRDKRIEEMESVGILVDYKKLSQEEYIKALRKKVVEEAQEVADEENRDKLVYELADLQEVVQALTKALEITDSEISAAQNRKRDKSDGFQEMHFTNFVEIENDNPVIEYYLQRPNKYPEIKQ